MNRRNSDTIIRDSLNSKGSTFLSKLSIAQNRISKRSPIFSDFLIGTALSVLLVGLTLAPSVLIRRGGSVTAFTESIATFSNTDCATPKSSWNLGETACAVATGAMGPRNIVWFAPNGFIAQKSATYTSSGTDRYSIPTTGDFAQPGTWNVRVLNVDGDAIASASFVVRDPNQASADLSVIKSASPTLVAAGDNINYTVSVFNLGPDTAQAVTLTDSAPANTTFVSASQTSGPAFTCSTASGVTTCIATTLAANTKASFTLVYNINAGTASGTVITDTASVSSTTNDPRPNDDSASVDVTVSSAPPTSPCAITCPANITQDNDPNQCSAVVTYTTPTPTGNCTDPDTGTVPPVDCEPPSGSTFPVGTTTVTCSVGAANCTFTVTVHDTRPPSTPTITCPANQTATEDPPGSRSAFVNYPAPTATGNCVTTSCSPPSGSNFPIGTTTVNCTATDSSNNSVSCSFTVTVTTACPFTCPANITQNSDPNQCGAIVNYTTPTTSGSCTITCNPASGSFFPVGATTVTCSNGIGDSCSFTVTVNDTQPPTITCPSNINQPEEPGKCSSVVTYSPTVSDNCPGATSSCNPPSGSTFPNGTTTVTCTATDASGNTSSCSFTVTVSDTQPPTITCPANITKSNDPGQCSAVVTFTPTVTDNCPGATATCTPPSGSTFPKGTTTVTCTATDAAGNTSSPCSFTVTVNDTEAPKVTCPADQTATLPPNTTATSMPVSYPAATATDNCPGVGPVTCSPPSGSTFSVGTTTVTCSATDASGNTGTCTFKVTVLYLFTGFFSPVSNPPILNVVNAGRTVPVKFSLSGFKGLNIFLPGFPASGQNACDASAPSQDVPTTTSGNSGLTYDPATDQYTYNWATDPAWAGTCRQFNLGLNDGSTHVANFKFK